MFTVSLANHTTTLYWPLGFRLQDLVGLIVFFSVVCYMPTRQKLSSRLMIKKNFKPRKGKKTNDKRQPVCNLSPVIKKSSKITRCIFNLSRNYKTRPTMKSLVFKKKTAIFRKLAMLRKAQFSKIKISIINLTIKKIA